MLYDRMHTHNVRFVNGGDPFPSADLSIMEGVAGDTL